MYVCGSKLREMKPRSRGQVLFYYSILYTTYHFSDQFFLEVYTTITAFTIILDSL